MVKKTKRKKTLSHNGHSHESLRFPKGFLWGASTSAHQVEGGNIHNDWWAWEQKRGKIKNDDRSSKATDHYHRFEEDFDIAAASHHNAHRFSIEWSRIEPREREWNWEEVDHYRAVLKALKKRKIKTMVTLHHFTNPVWIAESGGWENHHTAAAFARYAEFIAEHLGEYIDFWITINEPVIYTVQGYAVAEWPPETKSFFKGFRVFRHLAQGHKLAYREIHAEMNKQHRRARVGIAQNVISLVSYRKTFRDYLYVRFSEYVWNDLFFTFTKGTHDFIGVNYYFHQRVRRNHDGKYIFVSTRKEKRESSDLGWEIYAPGIFEVLIDLQKYGLPMYITENGIAAVNDDKRSRFIVSHLKEVYHAIKAGVDVRGYFYWSLLDNFEWDKGFEPRFGLVEVDYKTLKRTPRPSSYLYAHICKENAITHDLLRFIGHGARPEEPLLEEELLEKNTDTDEYGNPSS
ncbi:MAG: glycoside hydrolase family 1 protein [Candidatus Kerfeldbacteria bacterium]|nr:glycoside hydrolase family 1 protein [Candidatus Kerfeldbacteria bacterium]